MTNVFIMRGINCIYIREELFVLHFWKIWICLSKEILPFQTFAMWYWITYSMYLYVCIVYMISFPLFQTAAWTNHIQQYVGYHHLQIVLILFVHVTGKWWKRPRIKAETVNVNPDRSVSTHALSICKVTFRNLKHVFFFWDIVFGISLDWTKFDTWCTVTFTKLSLSRVAPHTECMPLSTL